MYNFTSAGNVCQSNSVNKSVSWRRAYSTPNVGGASFWGSFWNQTISTAGEERASPARKMKLTGSSLRQELKAGAFTVKANSSEAP